MTNYFSGIARFERFLAAQARAVAKMDKIMAQISQEHGEAEQALTEHLSYLTHLGNKFKHADRVRTRLKEQIS